MILVTDTIQLTCKGFCDFHNITSEVAESVRLSGIQDGTVIVFTPSATSAITTIEYESGALADFEALMERLAPIDGIYKHNERWHDGNGFSHLRAALVGPSVSVPFIAGTLALGAWQQITFIDFDNRSRNRQITLQMMGE